MTVGDTTTSQGKQEVPVNKTKAAPAAQQQWLKQQRCNIGGGFGGQWVVAVALVVALAMVPAEQWQQWVRQQSTKKRQQL
jgi:hypothetical protein